MSPPALELRGLAYAYPDGTPALRGIDLCIEPGQSVAVVGANGAGKSTLLLHLNGLLLPAAGQLWVSGLPVTPSTLVAVRRHVGYVFQDADDQLFMPTVHDDVAFGPRNQGLGGAALAQCVQAALTRVGAGHLADRAPYRLSGGEKRLVALAGVLACAPQLLVLDEPTAGLDAAARRRLIQLLQGLDQTRVLATHDLDLVLETCTRVLVLHEGRLQADGPPRGVLADAALMERCHLEPPPVLVPRR